MGCIAGEGLGGVYGRLAAVLFDKDDMHKKLDVLSGERLPDCCWLVWAPKRPQSLCSMSPQTTLTWKGFSLLRKVLEYEGTIIFVSHDRWFVDKVAGRILEITPDGIEDFPGTYAEYLSKAQVLTTLIWKRWRNKNARRNASRNASVARKRSRAEGGQEGGPGNRLCAVSRGGNPSPFTCLRPVGATPECLDALAPSTMP